MQRLFLYYTKACSASLNIMGIEQLSQNVLIYLMYYSVNIEELLNYKKLSSNNNLLSLYQENTLSFNIV